MSQLNKNTADPFNLQPSNLHFIMRKLIDAEITQETEKAYLIEGPLFDNGFYAEWFPKSQVEVETLDNGTIGDIYANEWIIDQKQDDIDGYLSTEEGF